MEIRYRARPGIDREGDEDAQGRDKMRSKSVEKRSMHQHHHHHRDNASETTIEVAIEVDGRQVTTCEHVVDENPVTPSMESQ